MCGTAAGRSSLTVTRTNASVSQSGAHTVHSADEAENRAAPRVSLCSLPRAVSERRIKDVSRWQRGLRRIRAGETDGQAGQVE